ncbi:hypothetical protein ABIE60_002500 [Marinobacterium sp. MBR-109]
MGTCQKEDDQLLKYENCKPSRSSTLPLFPVIVAADFPLAGFKIAPDVRVWQQGWLQVFLHMNMLNTGIHKRLAVRCKAQAFVKAGGV